MKNDIKKLLALLLLGTAAISGCAIDNGRYHRNDRHGRDRNHYHDSTHGGYNNGYNDRDRDNGYYNNH
ncbi:hypothetical protein A0256_21480 [Mucilaginibacter sp. PAMC 26640]|nr:hypothetical protein A0256_21480 [Mucilaginibacter sp. PAMC 26640]